MAFEKDPVKVAQLVIKKTETTDPWRIATRCGCLVLYADLGDINIAQRDTYKRVTVITLNERFNESIQRFALCHEIGHALLHRGFSTAFFRKAGISGVINWAEQEANTFAMEMMLEQFDETDRETMTKYELLDAMGLDYSFEKYM